METKLATGVLNELTKSATELEKLKQEHERNKRQREEEDMKERTEIEKKQATLEQRRELLVQTFSKQLDQLFSNAWKKATAQSDPIMLRYHETAKYLKQHGIPIVPITADKVAERYGEWLRTQQASVVTLSKRLPNREPIRFMRHVLQNIDVTYFDVRTWKDTKTYFVCDTIPGHSNKFGLGSQNIINIIVDKSKKGDIQHVLDKIVEHEVNLPKHSLLLGTSYVLMQEITRAP